MHVKNILYKRVQVILCLLFIIVSCNNKDHTQSMPQVPDLAVEVYIASPGTVENIIRLPGTILPNEVVELKTEIPGRIIQMNFSEGTRVVKGSLLVQIDDSQPAAELRKYLSQLHLAAEDEERKKELLAIKGVSQEVYDQALARKEELQADIDLVNAQIRKSKIIAPFSGVIGLRYISEGAYISGGDKIATLVQNDPVRIEFSVPEKYASKIHIPMDVQFRISGNENVNTAPVYAIEPMIDPDSRTLKVRARSANKEGRLVPGSFADITLNLEKFDSAIMIPAQAIIPALNSQNVFIIHRKRVALTPVETGIQTDRMVQITRGISPGDTVVLTGILALKNQMPVTISKFITAETETR
jgi:membrane fusion protein, multidrug efflux system